MSSRVDAVNRVVLGLIGLLLVATGGLGLALGFGAYGNPPPRVLPEEVRAYPGQQPWFWWVVGAGCALLALLGLWWLLAQLRTDRVARLDLTTDDRNGLTVVHAAALSHAIENEAAKLRGVTHASARLRQKRGRRLTLAVSLADHADIAEIRRALEGPVLDHARQVLEDPDLPVDIELRPDASRSAGRGLR